MKKLLLSAVAAVAMLTTAHAQETLPQLQKGRWLIETNLSPFSLSKTTGISFASNDGNSEWTVGGEGGYFVADKFALKAGLGIAGVNDGENTETILSYKIGGKYYINNNIPFQIDLGGLNSDGDNAFLLGAQLGYAAFIKENISIEPAVRYDHGLNDNASNVKTFSVRLGFALHF